jgi:hypothetical protein
MNEPRASKRNPVIAGAPIVTAIAAAAALVALRLHFQPPVVPLYALAADDAGAEERIVPDAAFAVTMAPATPVEGAVAVRGFLLRGEEVRPWDPPFAVERDGTVHVAGRTDLLFAGIPDGAWEMAFAVGRPEVLPTAPLDVLRAREHDPAEAGWHLVRRRISVAGMRGEPALRTP